MMKKRLCDIHLYLFLLSVFMIPASGCRKSDSKQDHAMAAQLFAKSVGTIRAYTDSLKAANDSASLRRLKEGINEKLAKINFQFPADTDLQMTEDENDSLISMIDRVVAIIEEKEKAINKALSPDSIPAKLPPSHTQGN